jgi:site-specific recombinase
MMRLRHLPGSPRTVGALADGLRSLPDGDGEEAWIARVEWFRGGVALLSSAPGPDLLREFAGRLREDGELAGRFRDAARGVFDAGQGLRLLADGGFPPQRPFLEDLVVRLVRSVVPPLPESRDLGDVLAGMVDDSARVAWLDTVAAEDLEELFAAAGFDDISLWRNLRLHLAEAARLHALRSANIGLAGDFRRAAGRARVADSPFHRLAADSAILLDAVVADPPDPAAAARARTAIEAAVEGCRAERLLVLDHLEATGVSTTLFHRLELLQRGIARLVHAVRILAPREGERPGRAAADLLKSLVADIRHEADVVEGFRDRSRMLARKIAERSGAAGRHYITVDRAEWWRMLYMGAGGGLVIALASVLKCLIYELHPPPGTLTLLVFLDYAGAFLAIFALHWTLATKQPPMTAAAMADVLSRAGPGGDTTEIANLAARISRSQFAGLLGNVLLAAAGAVGFDLLFRVAFGRPVLDSVSSGGALESHHPFASGTLFFAVITGFAVWLSSMVTGWAENLVAYGRLGESVASGRGHRGGRFTSWLVRNAGGVAGNVSLAGFLVGITFLGKIFGVPFDVRHVTMSTGQVALACSSLGEIATPAAAWAFGGVAAVGFLNIATGFLLSLVVAMRSRGTPLPERAHVLGAVLRAPLGNPLRFLYPVGAEAGPAARPAVP